jgi:ABC-type transport system involved in cytochrome c biogenesis permease subunit
MRAVRFPWQGASGAIMITAGLLVALALGRSRRQRLVAVGFLAVVVPAGWAGTELVDQLFAAF